MSRKKKESTLDESDYSTDDIPDTQRQILSALESPRIQQSEQLKKKVDAAEATFYKYLEILRRNGSVVSDKVGRNVYYALPKNKAELYSSTQSKDELEAYVFKKALVLLEEIYEGPKSKGELKELISRCWMLHGSVKILRETNPTLPLYGVKYHTDDATPRELKAFRDHKAGDLSYWHDYWFSVLKALGMKYGEGLPR